MLSRGNSDASTRLRKAKSSSSFKKPKKLYIDSQDPAIAHQQALDAAVQAYERAHSLGISSNVVDSRTPESRYRNSDNTGLSPQLGRRQSVRFAGPSAVPIRQRSITRRETLEYRKSQEVSQSHLKRKESSLQPAESLITALPDCDESALVGGGSLPSSYRKLRKAQSMFYPRKSPSVVLAKPQTKFDIRPYLIQPSSEGTDAYQQPQSLECGVLGSSSLPPGRTSSASRPVVSQERAVQEARDYYIRELEQQRLKKKPSFGVLGKHSKPQKPFRRTVRTSSTNNYGNAIGSSMPPAIEAKNHKTFGYRARSLSVSLKDKFKNLFHRHQESQEVVPVQQLDASRAHYGGYNFGVHQRYTQIPSPTEEGFQSSQSRDFALRSAPTILENESQPGSIRSIRSEDSVNNTKSRVTSWTNSTAADTLKSKLLEQKRLSIIQENGGPHQPSSSVHRYGGMPNGYGVFRKPARRVSSGGRATAPVDSHRVFSALQKRFTENERLSRQDEDDTNPSSSLSQHDLPTQAITPRGSFDLSRNSAFSKAQALDGRPSLHLDSPLNGHTKNISNPLNNSVSNPKSLEGSPTTQRSQVDYDEYYRPKRVDSLEWKRELREVGSAFFPQDVHLENRQTSPFRRAKRASADFEGAMDEDSFAIIRTIDNRSPISQSTVRGHGHGSTIGSGSIYSRTMSDQKPQLSYSSASPPLSESSGEPGTAVIIANKFSRSLQPPRPITPGDFPSARSSQEWKHWMASQVSQLEPRRSESSSFHASGPPGETGHRRENAQIHSDDGEIGKRSFSKNTPNPPFAAKSGNAMRPARRRVPSDTMVERFPLLDIGPPPCINGKEPYSSPLYNRSNTSLDREAPTPSNAKSPRLTGARSFNVLRTRSSQQTSIPRRSTSSYKGNLSTSSSTELSQIIDSYQTFTKTEPTLTKLYPIPSKRHSPERAARLRRKRSNISAASKGTENSRPTPTQSKALSHRHENQIIGDEKTPEMEKRKALFSKIEGTRGFEFGGANLDGHRMGSKNMVSQFLNSRKKGRAASEESNGDAFL